MANAKPVELPSMTFTKQGDAMDYFKTMLNRYSDGERINEDDSVLLSQLLKRHPDDKIGVGVEYFYRARNPEQPTSAFHVMRTDGFGTDFSYPKCVRGEKPTAESYFYRACRFAVSHYLTQKKNELFVRGLVLCSKTGESVTKENSEYRHTSPSFKELVDLFKTDNALNVDFSMFPPDRDMQYNVKFLNLDLERKFVAFHMEKANLAIFKK